MNIITDQDLFCVVYDIERPWNKEWSEKAKQPLVKLTEDERKELQRRKMWDKLIGRFVDELNRIGWRINWSVFLIPEKHYDKAKELVERYQRLFNDLGVKNDIYILHYHPDSNEILINKVKMHMKFRIEKLLKKYKETTDNSERKSIKNQIEMILDLAGVFGIYDEINSYLNKVSSEMSITIPTQKTLEEVLLRQK